MKTSLEHLPGHKREQIGAIAALLSSGAPVEMIILFGSYARGDWVEDLVNLYFSDYDLMVIVASEAVAADHSLWSGLSDRTRAIAGRIPVGSDSFVSGLAPADSAAAARARRASKEMR